MLLDLYQFPSEGSYFNPFQNRNKTFNNLSYVIRMKVKLSCSSVIWLSYKHAVL
jgi:hypothetical protein